MKTEEFARWLQGLPADRRGRVDAVVKHIVEGGPTLGRPHADVIHGSRLHKLKEARIDRGTRVLFAFDSSGDAVMLLGGDKTGKWNRWYPGNIDLAERLYFDHERSMGKEGRWLSQRTAGRPASQMDR